MNLVILKFSQLDKMCKSSFISVRQPKLNSLDMVLEHSLFL